VVLLSARITLVSLTLQDTSNPVAANFNSQLLSFRIPLLGIHGFRKTFAVDDYQRNLEAGQSDSEALLSTSRQLGQDRSKVTRNNLVPSQARRRD